MNIAYIISAYKLPELLVRLIRRLDGPHASFFVHVDAKTSERDYGAMRLPFTGQENVHFLARHACYWGDFGHVRATLKGLNAIAEINLPFDYVVLLTGQDYPIRSNKEIVRAFDQADGRIFLRHFRLPSEHWSDGGMDRIEHRQFRIGKRLFRFPGQPFDKPHLQRAWFAGVRLLGATRTFPPQFQPYGGSSYWCLPGDCIDYVLEFLRKNPRVVRFFRQTMVPDEMFFQTVIMNSPMRDRVVQDDLHYILWDEEAHPAILTRDHLEAFMASGDLFARKFDPGVDAAVLDQIDALLSATSSSPGLNEKNAV